MDLTAAASYLLAAIQNAGDRELAEDVHRAIAEILPYHLEADLEEAFDGLALA